MDAVIELVCNVDIPVSVCREAFRMVELAGAGTARAPLRDESPRWSKGLDPMVPHVTDVKVAVTI